MAGKKHSSDPIPVIDLFAGPGGLGEGFSAFGKPSRHPFHIGLSVEMNTEAHRTLKLRAFYRQFIKAGKDVPEDYYNYLRGSITRDELFQEHSDEAEAASTEACCAELGGSQKDKKEIRDGIECALKDIGKNPWVLIGGPPCQAYSLIGRVRTGGLDPKDKRVSLYTHYKDIVGKYKPAVFVMENVKGLLSARNEGQPIFRQIVDELTTPAKGVRYAIRSLVAPYDPAFIDNNLDGPECVIRMEKYGIPQKRHRVILLGIRSDIAVPEGAIGLLEPEEPVTIAQVIKDLPKLRSGLSKEDDKNWAGIIAGFQKEAWFKNLPEQIRKKMGRVTGSPRGGRSRGGLYIHKSGIKCGFAADWYSDPRLEGVCNHETRGHIAGDLARYLFAACFGEVHGHSPKISEFPAELLPMHRNVQPSNCSDNSEVDFADRFRVQVKDRPATTVTSHISKDGHYYIHYDPSQCRSLTVREAARIQTFPDNYFFEGPRTSQYTQVGNAVPPLLAIKISRVVHDILQPKK